MAIRKKKRIGIVDFIHPKDEAINTDINPDTGRPYSDIEKYEETWDFDKYCVLRQDTQPTIFKINFNLEYKKSIKIKNAVIGSGGKEEDAGFKLGSHTNAVVRTVLVDIINPDNLPLDERIVYKKDIKTDLVSDETMEELEFLGILDSIYSFWVTNKSDSEQLKKR